MSQPDVWPSAIMAAAAKRASFDALLAETATSRVIVTGCGSTHYLALTAARLLRKSGVDASACPASELLLHPQSICLPDQRYLLLCVSRSGTTSETLRAQQEFKSNVGGPVIAVACDSASPLALAADLAIAIDAAQEASVAQTRSFSSMAVALQCLAAGQDAAASAPLPALCRSLLEDYAGLARSLGQDGAIKKFFFLGSDALYGIACEAMLKMKEMSLACSEAYHTLEFRHGPMAMAGSDSLVIGLISPAAVRQEMRLLREMAEKGATILAIGPMSMDFQHQVLLPADLPAAFAPVLYLPLLQLLAYNRAIFNGCDPDNPRQLSAVVSLDDI